MFVLLTSVLCLTPILYVFTNKILPWNENRKELTTIHDPLLKVLPFADTHIPTAISTICMHLPLIIYFDEYKFTYFLWCMTITNYMKGIILVFCPLRIHPDFYTNKHTGDLYMLSKLTDPFVQDLMFSGHIATNTILWYCYPELQMFYFINGLILVICLLLSRTHYTIDIIIAPFIVSCTFLWTTKIVHILFGDQISIIYEPLTQDLQECHYYQL